MFDAIRNRFAGTDASLHFIDEDFGLSNVTEDPKLSNLKQKIIEVAKIQGHWGELKPAKWIPVEQLLEGLRRSGVEVLCFSSPEHKVLMVRYCDRPLSVVRPSVRPSVVNISF